MILVGILSLGLDLEISAFPIPDNTSCGDIK